MKPHKTLAVLMAAALLAAGCGRSGGGSEEEDAAPAAAVSGDFGDLKGICGPGEPTGEPAQGVTAAEIKVGVFTDQGFTKKSEFVDTGKVFTSWCNEAGGINGRKLVPVTRDSKLMEVRQRMIEACREDFFLVGGGAALDGLGVKDRLTCLLPSFAAQSSSFESNGSDLQITQMGGAGYDRYFGFRSWLLKEGYPGSAGSLGIITGDNPVTKEMAAQHVESMESLGGKFAYNEVYPTQGVSDWTPYAQAIKSKGVKGLVFLGDLASLAKLEQVMTNIGAKPDWIDANNNAYGPAFIQLAGKAVEGQNNLADLSGVHPLEDAAGNPATQQVVDLFKKYAPEAQVTLPAVRGFAAWVLFAKAATACGDTLTRKCVYEAALKETAWTAGGLQAPVDLSDPEAPIKCFNVEKATPAGWQAADFGADQGAYRCDITPYKLTGKYTQPLRLTDVGKSMSDLK